MGKEIFILIISLFSTKTMAQIEMFDESIKKVEEPTIQVYDSLRNISSQRYGTKEEYRYTYHHLIGQTLMYCGDPYSIFGNKGGFKTGSYYKVVGILPDNVGKGLYNRMELEDIKTGERKEEGDLSNNKYNSKWVVVGHYEKMKSLYVNKEFVYVGMDDVFVEYTWKKANGMISMETDTVTTSIPKESIWTCIGVQVKPRKKGDDMELDKRSPIVLIFDNQTYGKHYCYLEDNSGKPYKSLLDESKPLVCGRFQLKSYYDNVKSLTAAAKAKRQVELTKKFGASNAKLILDGYVRIGMTKEMCRESWGNPDDINRTVGSWGTHEQWVYGNSYLYFEENKLTSIQN